MADDNGEPSKMLHQILNRYIEKKIADLEIEMTEKYSDRIREMEGNVRREEQKLNEIRAELKAIWVNLCKKI